MEESSWMEQSFVHVGHDSWAQNQFHNNSQPGSSGFRPVADKRRYELVRE